MPMNKEHFLKMLDELSAEYPAAEELAMEISDVLMAEEDMPEDSEMPAEDEELPMEDEDFPMPPPRMKPKAKSAIPPELADEEEDEEELV